MMLCDFIGIRVKMIKSIFTLFLFSCCVYAGEVEDKIQNEVNDFVLSQVQNQTGDKVDVQVFPVDSRLGLSTCDQPLNLTLMGNRDIKRNATIQVECRNSVKSWKTFVPVKVKIQKAVITSLQPIAKGTLLSADNLTVGYIDDYLVNGDMTTDMNQLIGGKSKKDLAPNQPVRLSQICIVCRNDTVEIVASKGGLNIKTSGRALQDGVKGNNIRVQNIRSQKIISGTVIDIGRVQVDM